MSSIHLQDNKLENFPEQWENSWLVTKGNTTSNMQISLYGTPLYGKTWQRLLYRKVWNNKLSMCLLWRQIEPVHNVQKLAKRGVPYSLLSLSAIYLYFVNHCHSHRMSIYREKWNYFQFVTEQERSHSNCQNFLSKKYCP